MSVSSPKPAGSRQLRVVSARVGTSVPVENFTEHLFRLSMRIRVRRAMSGQVRPRRADAERNRERVLAAAEAPILFAGNYPPSPGFPLIPPLGGGLGTPSSSGSPPGGGLIPPPVYPIVGGVPTSPRSTPPVNVPEPGSGMLLATGLLFLVAVFAVASVRRRRKA